MVIRGHSENDWEQSGNKIAAREHNIQERGVDIYRDRERVREGEGRDGGRALAVD